MRRSLLHHQQGSMTAGYAVPVVAGLVVIGALSSVGDAIGAGLNEQTHAAAPTSPSGGAVGSRNEAASVDLGESNANPGEGTSNPVTSTQFAPSSADVLTPEPDALTSFANEMSAATRQAVRDMVRSGESFYNKIFLEHGDALSLSVIHKQQAGYSVEFPGRLSHRVDMAFSGLSPEERNAKLNDLDREAWASHPVGEKPVAAWNHGDAVSALLGDFVLRSPLEELLGINALGDLDALLSAPFVLGSSEESATEDPFSTKAAFYGEDLSFASITRLEHLANQGMFDPPTSEDFQNKIDDYAADAEKIRNQLKAIDTLEGEMGFEMTYYRDQLTETLDDLEDLDVMLKLEHARLAWEEGHEGADGHINPMAMLKQMGSDDAEGPLAEIRELYLGEGAPEMSEEELLLAIVGTDLHDKSVQNALNKSKEDILARIDELRSGLPEEDFSFDGLGMGVSTLAAETNAERLAVRSEHEEVLAKLKPLMEAHDKQHEKGKNEGLEPDEWKKYQEREKKIRGLIEQANELRAEDNAISERVNTLNKNGALVSEEYAALEPPKALGEEKNPKFFKERPEPGLAYPISGPRITSPYGYRIHPVHGDRRLHTGTDFVPTNGDYRILAAQRGTVVFAGDNGGFGNTIVIRHPDGSETSYSHLASMSVGEGAKVERGAHIGQMGGGKGMPGAGTSTGIHLHFEYFAPGVIPDNVTGYGASPGANYGRSTDCAGHLH